MWRTNLITLAIFSVSLTGFAFGQAAKPAPVAETPKPVAAAPAAPAKVDPLEMLKSRDAAEREHGFELIMAQMRDEPEKFTADQLRKWFFDLRSAGMKEQTRKLMDQATELAAMRDMAMEVYVECLEGFLQLDAGKKTEVMEILRRALKWNMRAGLDLIEKQGWPDALMAAGMGEETAQLAHEATLTQLGDIGMIERLQTLRIKALLSAGKNAEALSAAKGLFNVSSMAGTANAIKTFAGCLAAANGDDVAIVEKYRDEQVKGAGAGNAELRMQNAEKADAGETTRPADEGAKASSVFAAIKVDGAVYADALSKISRPMPMEEDIGKLLRTGNLLLLADRPADARLWFEQANRVCKDGDLGQVTEALARVMKAEDGTIGQAPLLI